MSKSKYVSAILAFLMFFSTAIPSFAHELVGPGGEPVPVTYRYFFKDNPPIPVGAVVEFATPAEKNSLGLKWRERIQAGFKDHFIILQGVEFTFFRIGKVGFNRVLPNPGDLGVIISYEDVRLANGKPGEDGVVDSVQLHEFRQWDEQERQLLEMARQFHEENLLGLVYIGDLDCGPQTVSFNGKEPKKGPYANSLVIPGPGNLTIQCSSPRTRESPAWTTQVKPGDIVGAFPPHATALDMLPWRFCLYIKGMAPRWQPMTIPQEFSIEVIDSCGFRERGDDTVDAVLSRLGFAQASWSTDPLPGAFTPYVWVGEGRVDLNLPPHHWVSVEQVEVGDDIYHASIYREAITNKYLPRVDGLSYLTWEAPFVFVHSPGNKDSYLTFEWKNYPVFRVVRSGFEKATIQKIVWE